MGWRRVAEQELSRLKPETLAYLQAYSDGVNAYLHRHSPSRDLAGVHRARAEELRLPGRGLDAGGLGRLAQGDGVGPARQHGRRDPARPDVGDPDPGGDRRAVPGLPLRPAPADRRPGRGRGRGLRAGRDPRRHPQAVAPAGLGRPPSTPWSGCTGRSRTCRRCSARATASAATPGSSTATTPRPASRSWPTTRTSAPSMPGIWYQMGLHCTTLSDDCPFDVSGFTFSGLPGRGHRPQPADRLGLHEPRPRRHRPLPREGGGQDATCTTAGAAAASMRDEDDRGPRPVRAVPVHGPRPPGTARCCPTCQPSSARSARTPRRRRGPPTRGNGYAVSLAWTALTPSTTADAIFELRPGDRLGAVPRRGRGTSRRPRRTSSTPTGPATSATRRPGRIPIRKSGNTGDYPAPGWLKSDDWTGDVRPVRRAAQRAEPLGRVRRDRQPGRDRPELPLLPRRLVGLRATGASGSSTCSSARAKVSVADMSRIQLDTRNGFAPTFVPYLLKIFMPLGVPLRRPAAAERLGLHAGPGLGRGGVLQRGLEEHCSR